MAVDSYRPSNKASLMLVSRAMEEAFDSYVATPQAHAPAPSQGLVLALFQRREYFDAQADRYAGLAAHGNLVIVGFQGPGDDLPDSVVHVDIPPDDPLGDLWTLLLVRDHFAAALLARDTYALDRTHSTLEASRVFDARWSFDRSVALAGVDATIEDLSELLAPDVADRVRGIVRSSEPLPVRPVEIQLASAAALLIESLHRIQEQRQTLTSELRTARDRAERDQLTGLHNRHHLERYLGSGNVAQVDLVALLVDVDDLKPVNDTLGHEAGDALIVEVARALTDVLGDTAVVVRWGGDEFVALLPAADAGDDMEEIGVRLSRTLSRRQMPPPYEDIPLGVSVGAARMRSNVLPLEDLDRAMYDMKWRRKNLATVAPVKSSFASLLPSSE